MKRIMSVGSRYSSCSCVPMLGAISLLLALLQPSSGWIALAKNNNHHHHHRRHHHHNSGKSSTSTSTTLSATASTNTVTEVPTVAIPGMKPGTSGLRKKVEVWQEEFYVENFIQSLIETAQEKESLQTLDTIIVAGDGRYYNEEAMQRIFGVLAGNGVSNIWVPRGGIMSTPAVSAAIRLREQGRAQGGIILTASHNPGGPGEDFGIKYNEGFGQPAGEDFTDKLYEKSLVISSFRSISSSVAVDLNAEVGTTFALTATSSVTIIDPFDCYMDALKSCFDFEQLREFVRRDDFSLLFDGMHGAGGPFAKRVFCDELGLPESSLFRCNPLVDFGRCHPDPNLTYAADLIKKMGLRPDGSPDSSATTTTTQLPTLGAANDGDGDRNLIAGAGVFVTPSDSLAVICDQWEAIPHFARRGGPRGVARSMPSSAALDVVARARNIPCFNTPTGWKFFGNLMSSQELFDGVDYTPFLCGEESFGTGSDHIREKDGLWAVLAWMSILMKANNSENKDSDSSLVGVKTIVMNHWAKYGRHFYCRYDYEAVESEAANQVMDLIREKFVNGDVSSLPSDPSDFTLVDGVEFAYTDPVDGSQTSRQGLILNFVDAVTSSPSRVVFRLSGTGSAGATIRMYIEKYDADTATHGMSAPKALQSLADCALGLVQLERITGRASPTVIT